MNTPTGTVSLYLSREDWQTLRNTAGAEVERLQAEQFVAAASSVAGLTDAQTLDLIRDTLAPRDVWRQRRAELTQPYRCPACHMVGCAGTQTACPGRWTE